MPEKLLVADNHVRPKIILKAKRDASVRHGHPWIFSGAIADIQGDATEGTLVDVYSHNAECLGSGHYYTRDIAVRMLSRSKIEHEQNFITASLTRALILRQSLGLTDDPTTTAYRLVNAEGDFLPGLVVDVYGETLVIQCQLAGMLRWREDICAGLRELFGKTICGIYEKRVGRQTKDEDALSEETTYGEYLWGQAGNPIIRENNLKFHVDWERGQKTGFYLDQRDNRSLLQSISLNRRVLNLFCYTGGFSAYALAGGAAHVESVDASKPSLELLAKNIALNDLPAVHSSHAADCFSFLAITKDVFDVVVVDPPAFVKHRRALDSGIRAYESLNAAALEHIIPGGVLLTFSCSQLVDDRTFRSAVARAGARNNRSLRIICELSQSPCHPINIHHPEGRYLKGLAVFVD